MNFNLSPGFKCYKFDHVSLRSYRHAALQSTITRICEFLPSSDCGIKQESICYFLQVLNGVVYVPR